MPTKEPRPYACGSCRHYVSDPRKRVDMRYMCQSDGFCALCGKDAGSWKDGRSGRGCPCISPAHLPSKLEDVFTPEIWKPPFWEPRKEN